MNCEYEERIALYVEGDLTPAEAAEAERHIASCRECTQLESDLRESQAVLKSLATAAPTAAVRARVLESLESSRRRTRWLAAAAALFLTLGSALIWNQQQQTPATPGIAHRPAEPVAQPSAAAPDPVVRVAEAPKRRRRPRSAHKPAPEPRLTLAQESEPLVVKMLTDDPDVVIIWLVDGKDGQDEENPFGADSARGE